MIRCLACNTDNPIAASRCATCGATLAPLQATADLDRAEASIMHGDLMTGQAELQQARDKLIELDGAKAAHALISARARWLQGTVYYIKGQTAQAVVEVNAAIALLVGDEGGKPLLAAALNTLGNIEYLRGDMRVAQNYYQRGVQLAEQLRNRQLAVKLWTNLGNISVNEGRTYEALFRYNKATQYAEMDNHADELVMSYRMLCYIYVVIGPLAKAMDYARRITELLPQLESLNQTCNALITVGMVNRYYGDLEQASSYLQAALGIAERSENKVIRADALAKLGQVYLDAGDYERSYEVAQRLFGDEAAPQILKREAASQLVQYQVARRDFAAAREYVDWLQNFEQQQGWEEPERLYLPVAIYFAALGDWERAIQTFDLAIEQSKRRGDSYELGRDYLEYARAIARREEASYEQVMHLLEQAAAVFRKLGAVRNLATVERLLEREITPALGNPSE